MSVVDKLLIKYQKRSPGFGRPLGKLCSCEFGGSVRRQPNGISYFFTNDFVATPSSVVTRTK